MANQTPLKILLRIFSTRLKNFLLFLCAEFLTIDGGKSNDSLWGNAGADTFLYFKGEGKDVIYGFEDDDMLLITGDFSTTYIKSTAIPTKSAAPISLENNLQ